MIRHWTWSVVGLAVAMLPVSVFAQSETSATRVFHVGNSVTETIRYELLKLMANDRSKSYTYGRHVIGGSSLGTIWNNPSGGYNNSDFGFYPQALPNNTWDAITLQPFNSQMRGSVGGDPRGDLDFTSNFVSLARQHAPNANTQVYIYARWPTRTDAPGGGYLPLQYQTLYDRAYTATNDNTYETRDYFRKLAYALGSEFRSMPPVKLVPAGDVLYQLDQKMEAGLVPGYSDISQLYNDWIHFDMPGSYVIAETFYATLFNADPRGQPVNWYGTLDPTFVSVVQQTVYEVVHAQGMTVVVIPEPGTAAAALGALAVLAGRRRRRA
jgi:hypothetical protein